MITQLDAMRGWVVDALGLSRLASRDSAFGGAVPLPAVADPSDDAVITVLIPSFEHERYIGDALRSVLAQTYPRFRVVVVDDASSDGTVHQARMVHDPRIEVTVNARNRGLGASLMDALESVDTPLVAILNSDDLFHPDRLRRCCEVLQSRADVDVVATGMHLIDGRGRQIDASNVSRVLDGLRIFHWTRWYDRISRALSPSESVFVQLLRHNHLLTSSNIVCRTEFLRGHAGHLTQLKYCLDWYLLLAAAAGDRLVTLPEPLLGYRLHGTNTVWFGGASAQLYAREVLAVAAAAVDDRLRRSPPHDRPGELAAMMEALRANDAIDPVGLEELNAAVQARGTGEMP